MLPLAVAGFARLVLGLALAELLGILLRRGDDRRIFTGALQNHVADLLALLSLDGTDHRRGCGPERIFFAQGSEPLFPFGLAVADLIDVSVGRAECLLGVCAEGLFCLLALLRIGNILKLVVTRIHRELSGFFFGFRAGLVLLLRALERLHRVGIGLVAGAAHGASWRHGKSGWSFTARGRDLSRCHGAGRGYARCGEEKARSGRALGGPVSSKPHRKRTRLNSSHTALSYFVF